ncbi:polysaccharide pyruvyl transferase family protein [Sphingobium sp.]|uniref:polysaccharide pyruvyl transferase family protein n=1 Tax=Sphingobium sp. TaxID=1912891 RepID=UPI003B3A32E9
MKLYFFRGHRPNFGDELNCWLLPKVFPDFFDEDPSDLFLGIGSIIFDSHPRESRKIVFGSGYGGYTAVPAFDDRWTFYSVRGPRTAKACGLSPDMVAADAAVLIHRYRNPAPVKTIRRSFMPHWESVGRGHWELACRLAGIHFLDPSAPVEQVIAEMEASDVVITEAMHGAIVSDALRVPWVPITPFHAAHRFKWHDWAEALDMTLQDNRLAPSSALEAAVARDADYRGRWHQPSGIDRIVGRVVDVAHVVRAAATLRKAAAIAPTLSSDEAITRAVERLEADARRIRQDFGR